MTNLNPLQSVPQVSENKKILPLFGNPLIKKFPSGSIGLNDRLIYKFNFSAPLPTVGSDTTQTVNSKSQTDSNLLSFSTGSILEYYLKGLDIYNKDINKILNNSNNQNLIIKIKNFKVKNNWFDLLTKNITKILSILNKKNINLSSQKIVKTEKPINYSSLNLAQKILIKKIIINPNFNYFCSFIGFKKNILKKKDFYLIIKLINNSLINKINNRSCDSHNIIPMDSISNFNSNYPRYERNSLEKILSCFILLNILKNQILIKKNKIKLLNFIKILYLKKKDNEMINKNNIVSNYMNSDKKISMNKTNLLINIKKNLVDNININNNYLNSKTIIKNEKLGSAKEICKFNLIKINQTALNILGKNEQINKEFKYNLIPLNNNIIPVSYNINKAPILNKYIKNISIFNLKNKGILFNYSNTIGYYFTNKKNKLRRTHTTQNIYKFLYAAFYSMSCLISKPIFVIKPNKIIIQLFYFVLIPNLFKFKIRNKKNFTSKQPYMNRNKNIKYNNNLKYKQLSKKQRIKFYKLATMNIINLYTNRFKKICLILSKFLKKHVELDLIRLHYPYNDSNILVNLLGFMINKIKIRIIIRKLFKKAIIKNPNKLNFNSAKNKISILPAFLSGMNIRIAGRLLTQKVIPRKTVKTIRRGVLAKGKINYLDVARLTKKNKRGSFSITISSGHNFK